MDPTNMSRLFCFRCRSCTEQKKNSKKNSHRVTHEDIVAFAFLLQGDKNAV